MYGNRIKHNLLMCYTDIISLTDISIHNPIDVEIIKNRFVNFRKGKIKDFDRYLTYLAAEDYVKITPHPTGVVTNILMPGMSAVSNKLFLKENLRLVLTSMRDIAFVICNFILGITAIVAIYKTTNTSNINYKEQIQELQGEINKIQYQLQLNNHQENRSIYTKVAGKG